MPLNKWEPWSDIERFFGERPYLSMFPKLGWDLAVDVFEEDSNVVAKMIAQPLFAVFLVALFAMKEPLSRELILMCAIPSSAFAVLLAPRYNAYETEAASTLVLTSFAMVAIMPLAILLTRGM